MTLNSLKKVIILIFSLCAICNIWILVTTTLFPAMSSPPSSPSAACNSFSMSLFKQLVEMNNNTSSGNVFYSPVSICSALAMVLLGARGNTATQMSQVLHFHSQATDDDHLNLSKVIRDLNNAAAGEKSNHTLSLVSRLYGEVSYQFVKRFLSDTVKLYNAQLEPVDFVRDAEGARLNINGWVEKQTQGKIKELLASDAVDHLTRLVLVNGLYFKGKWDKPFSEAATGDTQFRLGKTESKPVKMMYQSGTFPLAFVPEVECQVLELPYAGGDLSMVVFLPVETEDGALTGLERLEEEMTYERFVEWTDPAAMHRSQVEVGLPRFKMEETYDMEEVLTRMGMVDAFDKILADFGGMSPANNLYVSKVVHKACVEVNEEGSEAVAGSAAVMTMKSARPRFVRFVADHPFLFFIRHKPTMSILFAGRYCSPP